MAAFLCGAPREAQAGTAGQRYVDGEVIVAIESGAAGLKGESEGKQKELLLQRLCRQGVYRLSYLTETERPAKWRSGFSGGSRKGQGKAGIPEKLLSGSGKKLDFYIGTLADGTDVEDAVLGLKQQEDVFWAEPNYLCHVMEEKEAPAYPFSADELVDVQWYLDDIRAKDVWRILEDEGKAPGQGVTVAVVDTGVSIAHSDLEGQIWVNEAEAQGEEGADDDGNGYVDDINGANLVNYRPDMTDTDGHGTMMAGIIAMGAGNGGGAGIAYGAKVMPVKVSMDGSFGVDAAAEGILYASDNGADIINMSFGTYDDSLLLQSAVNQASKQCLLVAAAGNESLATEDRELEGVEAADIYPAAYDTVVGVMAYDMAGNIADFSNWDSAVGQGAEYEIAAPGVQIYSTALRNRYENISGTSPASAVAAGAMAVCRGLFADRQEYPAPALQRLFIEAMCHTLSWSYREDVLFSYKKLQLMDVAALAQQRDLIVDKEPPKAEDMTVQSQSGKEITFQVRASDNFGVQAVTLYYCLGSGQEWNSQEMDLIGDGSYQLSVPRKNLYQQEISYYFDVYDGIYHTEIADSQSPLTLVLYGSAAPSGDPDSSGDTEQNPGETLQPGDGSPSGDTGQNPGETLQPGDGSPSGDTGQNPGETLQPGDGNPSGDAGTQPGDGNSSGDAGTQPGDGNSSGDAGAQSDDQKKDGSASKKQSTAKKKIKKLQKTAPVIKRKYLRTRKKARLTFKIKGNFSVSAYYLYCSSRKKGDYRLVKKVKKPSVVVKVTKKRKYYKAAACVKQNGRKYKSKKSEVVICFQR